MPCPYPGCNRQSAGHGAGGRYCSLEHRLKDEDVGGPQR